jgi:hypothetical protein
MLTVPVDGETYKVRVMEINRGADYTHEIKGLIAESATLLYSGDGDDGDPVVDDVYTPPPMVGVVLDCPALHHDGLEETGHYVAGCTSKIDMAFTSAAIYRSTNSSSGFTSDTTYPQEGMLVEVLNAQDLNRANRGIDAWDRKTQIRIQVKGPLSTSAPGNVTEDVVLRGGQVLITGGELICFQTVTSVGDVDYPRDYYLTNLIRGRRSTSDFCRRHAGFPGSADITITDYTVAHTVNLTLKGVDGVARVYVGSTSTQDPHNNTFRLQTSNAVSAANLAECIAYGTGVNGAGTRFAATVDDATVTITQNERGSAGNTDIYHIGTLGMTIPDAFTGGADDSETGVVLTYQQSGGIVSLRHEPDLLYSNLYYKFVAQGDDASTVIPIAQQCTGRRVRPFAVGNLRGYKATLGPSPTNDWILKWARCDRGFFKLFSAANTPNTDGTELYRCRIINPVTGATVRTIGMAETGTGITATQYNSDGTHSEWPTLTYTEEDQALDGWDTKTELWVEVYRYGSVIAEGVNERTVISAEKDYSL